MWDRLELLGVFGVRVRAIFYRDTTWDSVLDWDELDYITKG